MVRVNTRFRLRTIGSELRMKARMSAMQKLVDLPLSWHENEATGAKMQKIQSGSESIYRAASFFSFEGGEILVSLVGGLIIFLFVGWKYALFCILYASCYLIAEYFFNRRVHYWEEQLQASKEKVSGKIHESVSNIMTVQSLGLRRSFEDKTSQQERSYHRIWLSHKKVALGKTRVIRTLAILGYILFFFMVGMDVAAGALTVGSILVLTNYFGRLREGLETLSDSFTTIIEIKTGMGRLMSFLDIKTDDRDARHLKVVPQNWKEIAFKNITFSYKDKEIFKDFNFIIKNGEKIGIVGGSGQGKSTLAKLLLGLYTPEKGTISIDGVNINEYTHSSLLQRTSIVLQDSEIFNVSLEENIRIVDPRSKKKIEPVLEMAHITPLIRKLPKGMQTVIGEKGYKVSGGERQRIGLARALFKGSNILILDEATSHLDSKTESIIQHNLATLEDKTVLVIAHRLSTLKNTDRIIVIERGKIVEEGSFTALIKKRGRFYEYYKHQRHL